MDYTIHTALLSKNMNYNNNEDKVNYIVNKINSENPAEFWDMVIWILFRTGITWHEKQQFSLIIKKDNLNVWKINCYDC